ncbi:MAG: hypothetical protein QW734_08225 [Candidatus Bathyarchaeia archaeon]
MFNKFVKFVAIELISLFFIFGVFFVLIPLGRAGDAWTIEISDKAVESTILPSSEMTARVYLPLIFRDYGPRSSRLGYCATDGPITRYSDIRRLAAGWYVNFGVQRNPARPLGLEYVQTIRLHQLTTCWPQRTRNRDACPYTTPYTYTLTSPGTREEIVAIAQANPGSLWLIGNEMDRYDWDGGGQDEMLPEVYAVAYHELYYLIKDADPTAKVAIGGVIQATPARLWYLSTVWDTYRSRYGTDMPVDVWNVHNFIFKERCDDYGADVPPGYPSCYGTVYNDNDHDNLEIFKQQIRAFRQWMKDRGQQNKPLIVSEYGIVYYHIDRLNSWDAVRNFMLATFDYFMNEKDCNLGYPADNCRLVQRWAWYSLDDSRGIYNDYAYLFHQTTLQITPLGEAFAAYAQNHLDTR